MLVFRSAAPGGGLSQSQRKEQVGWFSVARSFLVTRSPGLFARLRLITVTQEERIKHGYRNHLGGPGSDFTKTHFKEHYSDLL